MQMKTNKAHFHSVVGSTAVGLFIPHLCSYCRLYKGLRANIEWVFSFQVRGFARNLPPSCLNLVHSSCGCAVWSRELHGIHPDVMFGMSPTEKKVPLSWALLAQSWVNSVLLVLLSLFFPHRTLDLKFCRASKFKITLGHVLLLQLPAKVSTASELLSLLSHSWKWLLNKPN